MSHKTEVQTQFTDIEQLKKTCEELGYRFEETTKVQLFESGPNGLVDSVAAVHIPGWRYPVAIKEDGTAAFDNYNGSWGSESNLDSLRQKYAENVALSHAERSGYRVLHRENINGNLQLRLGR
jgi:hypothetical protein